MSGYVFLEHMSDALIESYGESVEEAFSNAACGLIDTMVDIRTINHQIESSFDIRGSDLENLLYNWLESVLLKIYIDELVFSYFKVVIKKISTGFSLVGIGKGEKLDILKHKAKTAVKSVTYHLMRIVESKGKVSARFLLDL